MKIKYPKLNIEIDGERAKFIFALSIVIVTVIASGWYAKRFLDTHERIKYTEHLEILDTNYYTTTTFIFVGGSEDTPGVMIPIINHHYRFYLENKGWISVSGTSYNNYRVGDIYPYTWWEWIEK